MRQLDVATPRNSKHQMGKEKLTANSDRLVSEDHLADIASNPPRVLTDEQFSSTVAAIVSAFGDPTRREIYLFTRESSGITATEVATRFLLHPNVARHHLDKLAAGGYLDVYIDRSGISGAGRPSKKYRVSKREGAIPIAPQSDELVSLLLVSALERLSESDAECMAEEVGEKYGKLLATQMQPGEGQRSLHFAMRAIADALTAHGFAARSESSSNSNDVVISHSCPFGDVAISHPVLCAVDRGIVKGMLSSLYGTPVPIKMSSKARGDDSCALSV